MISLDGNNNSLSESIYCLVCKEVVGDKYTITVQDRNVNNKVEGYLCRECFNRFLSSHHNESFFKLSKMMGWMKERKDRMRWL